MRVRVKVRVRVMVRVRVRVRVISELWCLLSDAAASTSRPSNEHIEATVRRCVEAANGTLRCCLC